MSNVSKILGRWIRTTAEQMMESEGRVNLLPFRRLERDVETISMYEMPSVERSTVFFLAAFIRDVFSNLSGDLQYSGDFDRIKQDTLAAFVRPLKALATAVDASDATAQVEASADLIREYFNGIKRINALTIHEVANAKANRSA